MMANVWSQFLVQWLTQTPVILVFGAGAMLALARWSRHPRASLLALIGLLLLLGLSLLLPAIQHFWIHTMQVEGRSGQDLAARMMAFAVLGSLLRAAGYALVVAAVFADRKPPAAFPGCHPNTKI